jgi:hypothetical protein
VAEAAEQAERQESEQVDGLDHVAACTIPYRATVPRERLKAAVVIHGDREGYVLNPF